MQVSKQEAEKAASNVRTAFGSGKRMLAWLYRTDTSAHVTFYKLYTDPKDTASKGKTQTTGSAALYSTWDTAGVMSASWLRSWGVGVNDKRPVLVVSFMTTLSRRR